MKGLVVGVVAVVFAVVMVKVCSFFMFTWVKHGTGLLFTVTSRFPGCRAILVALRNINMNLNFEIIHRIWSSSQQFRGTRGQWTMETVVGGKINVVRPHCFEETVKT